MWHAAIDLTGQVFGRLTVVGRAGTNDDNKATWLCRCECGSDTVKIGKLLRRGFTKSCGCLISEVLEAGPNSKHGHSPATRRSPEYNSWCGMKKRCFNRNSQDYPEYGGRGITVCYQWKNSFEAFLADMGPQPGKGYSIDRINNDGNYERGNCRWATDVEQAANRRQRRWHKKPRNY